MAALITLIICVSIILIVHRNCLSSERIARTELEGKSLDNERKELDNQGEEIKIRVLAAETQKFIESKNR